MLGIFNNELEENFNNLMLRLYEKINIETDLCVFGDFNFKFLPALNIFPNLYTNKHLNEFNINNIEFNKDLVIISNKNFEEVFNKIKYNLNQTTYIKVKHITENVVIDTPKYMKNKKNLIKYYSFNCLGTSLISEEINKYFTNINLDNINTIRISSKETKIKIKLTRTLYEEVKTLEELKKRYLIGRINPIREIIIPSEEDFIISKDMNLVTDLYLSDDIIYSNLSLEDLFNNMGNFENIDKNNEFNNSIRLFLNYLIIKNLTIIYVDNLKAKNDLISLGLSKTVVKVKN